MSSPPAPTSFIASRSFNTLTLRSNLVIKTSDTFSIRGELFFYQHIPSPLTHLFPRLHWHKLTPSNHTSLAIDLITGIPLSILFISFHMTLDHLSCLLHRLHSIHCTLPAPLGHSALVYANYSQKVNARWRKYHNTVYHQLQLTYNCDLVPLICNLQEYQSERRALPVGVVHGDPVFTNVILQKVSSATKHELLKFIDMRGAQHHTLTLCGDAVYDLAKVFQSLCLYDFIIHDVRIHNQMVPIISRLHHLFHHLLKQLYPQVCFQDVLLVTTSLFFSLIPLHQNYNHRQSFVIIYKTIKQYLYHLQSSHTNININQFVSTLISNLQ